jgi:2-polyprenyl-3-methyl-5-hydroxy-6-metoxy-1,4-benzoquinol methylase
MTKTQNFNYEKVSIAVNQDRSKGFHKKIFDLKPELRRVVEMVNLKKGKILDIGCGGGLMTECLPEYFPDAKIYGCDISQAAIQHARKYGNGKVSYKVMTNKFPFPSNYFDACLCLDVLEHVPDDKFFLNEIKRILKKDGLFFSAIPCEGQAFTLSWFFKKIGFLKNLTLKHVGHIHPEYTHNYIVKLFESKNFKILQKKYSERIPVQFIRYFLFMIPKEILEFVLGSKKAAAYNDRSILERGTSGKRDLFMYIRKFLFGIRSMSKLIDDIDAEHLNGFSFGAWKINLLVKNGK